VHRFPTGRVGHFEHQRQGKVVARIEGVSRSPGQALDDSGCHRDAKGLFTVGVSFGTAAAPGAEGDRVHYMALGGQHRRQTVDQSPGIAHYAGTPQGRDPSETGACGCSVVTVDEAGHVKTNFVATDVVRWTTETIEVTAGADELSLLGLIEQRISSLRDKHPDRDLLITWNIRGRGELLNQLRPGGLSDELISHLRKQYGHGSPAIWTVGIECQEPLCIPAEWYDEETIRGDLLRQFREMEAKSELALALEEFLPVGASSSFAELAHATAADRTGLLVAASKLSVGLLGLDEDEE
jgi:hypothetical protein